MVHGSRNVLSTVHITVDQEEKASPDKARKSHPLVTYFHTLPKFPQPPEIPPSIREQTLKRKSRGSFQILIPAPEALPPNGLLPRLSLPPLCLVAELTFQITAFDHPKK